MMIDDDDNNDGDVCFACHCWQDLLPDKNVDAGTVK